MKNTIREEIDILSKERLISFYINQYKWVSSKNIKKNVRVLRYLHKINAKAKTLRALSVKKNQGDLVTSIHQDVKKLAFLAYHYNNGDAIKIVNKQIIPQLVRLDLMLFDKKELEELTDDFIVLLKKRKQGAICNKNLREIYLDIEHEELRKEIMTLVPKQPEHEFPEALEMNRHFILHVGATNSGKTYNALERLKEARQGIYLGPLRLLALEVYEKMMDNNVECTMLTGQECIETPESRVISSTIEMLDIDEEYDIAVVDEAQMISDDDRGHSWTRAILGLKAKEIHVCMSPVGQKVITHLIELCGDDYEIREYQRKTPLVVEKTPFSFPEDVKDKDALIVFSKKSVLNIAGRLEENGIKSSVVYGSLPPEIRRRQIGLFNEGKTNVVVSTDAIGMGLNLPVRRIVFMETEKFDGVSKRGLNVSEVKQIAGRAGRFGKHDEGLVNALGDEKLEYISKTIESEETEIENVSLGFPQVLLDMEAPLDTILKVWHEQKPSFPFEKINIDDILFLYNEAWKNRHFIADFDDKRILYRMITCPIDIKDRELIKQWRKYCLSYTADVCLGHPSQNSRYKGLMKYESYYKKLDLYYQMSIRLGKLIDMEWLEEERDKVQSVIMRVLSKDKNKYITRCKYCGKVLPVGSKQLVCSDCLTE